VGGTTALTSLTTNAGGTTAINGGVVTTSGAQTYNDAVTVNADLALAATTVAFAETVTGANARLGITGNVVFGDATTDFVSGLDTLSVSGTTIINTNAISSSGAQNYVGTVSALTQPQLTISSATGSIVAINASNDFSGALIVNSNGVDIRDANALQLAVTNTGGAKVTTGGALIISGSVAKDLQAVVGGALSFGALSVGTLGVNGVPTYRGFLDATANGNTTQSGKLTVAGDLWIQTGSGDIDLGGYSRNALTGTVSLTGFTNELHGTVSLIAPMAPLPFGLATILTGSDVSLKADSIRVGTVRPLDGSTTNVGITAARVTIQVPDGARLGGEGGTHIQADGLQGLITANAQFDSTPTTTAPGPISALTVIANGPIGNPNTANPTTEGLRVETEGLVTVVTNLAGVNIVNLVGNPTIQPKYEFSGVPGKRSVKYNGVEATSSQLSGALDAAYLDIRNQTTEIRESGFAKENANKILRRGVVTSAGPGQPAVDDSSGLAQVDACDGNFLNSELICQ
jgi:mucin-19